ncbi:hotdog fold thioesterase [Sphingobacterium bovistauri]|uniref:Hotdog fold thioesterase n=1 Tax=Sphingobacterium bovistauri TaxID=2781959 RepID=A0ABS7ZBF8_9SPHI|nr:hotdog fold thioesterase [Sphingobacterium bovistauri]MCA5006044.1 hotdog fold thioesterase [Sphingobacterium bovistauri]
MIWRTGYKLEDINVLFSKYMTGLLDIKATSITGDSLVASMPITEKVLQPYGILHGGASVVLAESVGSVASALIIDTDTHNAVGLEVNANHLRPGKLGNHLDAVCTPIHLGRTTHVWDIKISDDKKRLICISRLTVAIIKK